MKRYLPGSSGSLVSRAMDLGCFIVAADVEIIPGTLSGFDKALDREIILASQGSVV
ncbi:MAG: hypothetical protein PHO83_08680 [Geobacteraceae bacterium]|nr:hypothetical protein [Geobacteraceae bacterium]